MKSVLPQHTWQISQRLAGGHGMLLCGFSRSERPDYSQSLSSEETGW